MSLNQTKPNVISLKKWISLGAGGLIILGLLITLINLISNIIFSGNKVHKAPLSSTKTSIATTQHPAWIEQSQVKKVNTPSAVNTPSTSSSQMTKETKEPANEKLTNETYQKAMMAPISSNQITASIETNERVSLKQNTPSSYILPNGMPALHDDTNRQAAKKAFLDNTPMVNEYLPNTVTLPKKPFEIKAGTIIPGVLITGINSDLPGQVTARVRNNVYDTVSGKYLLIPQGTTIVGLYNSEVSYGQERVQIIWNRLIFPNGQSLNLRGMPGADVSGYSGFNDQVNNHYTKIFGSTIVMSALAAGAQLSQPQQSQNPFAPPSVNQTLAQSLGTNIANTGNALLSKNLGIQPTLEIRPGYLFNVEVTKDAIFPQPYSDAVIYEDDR